MSIIQISKIQQRSGDLVDLPQLDQAELGFASDAGLLFIGKTAGDAQNIEVLTAFSEIAFSQIDGSAGNLDINSAQNGQILSYDGINWVNKGGNALQPDNASLYSNSNIHLGNVSNVFMGGGAIGYTLTTDGGGNLSWTPKGIVSLDINTISNSTDAIVTLKDPFPFPYANITINGISPGNYASNLNAGTFAIAPIAGNIQIYNLKYTNGANVDTSTWGTYPSNTGTLIFNTVSANGSSAGVAGSIQLSVAGAGTAFTSVSGFTYDAANNTMYVPGVISANGNITTSNVFVGNGSALTSLSASNINTGTLSQARLANSNVILGNTTLTLGTTTTAVTGLTSLTGNGTATFGTLQATTLTTGANTTAGTITGNWSLSTGSKLNSTYADLAEYYSADDNYEYGTVLEFGGTVEVTIAKENSNKIAGVVSKQPAYVMNSEISHALHSVMLALIGRVPVKTIGKVSKGDMMISAGNGYAISSGFNTPIIGTVIGKAISNKTDMNIGYVEILVGRL